MFELTQNTIRNNELVTDFVYASISVTTPYLVKSTTWAEQTRRNSLKVKHNRSMESKQLFV